MAIGNLSLSDNPSLQDLLEVESHFGLPSPALVEKDWYVVKALAAISTVGITPFRLVFGGGTALSRVHRLIRRMSEDIDLKIVSDAEVSRPALRDLRDAITNSLLDAGLKFDPKDSANRESGNASRYTLYRLPYTAIAKGRDGLRPEIQIETAVWPLHRPAVALPVTSFIAEAFKLPPEVAAIPCASIVETVAEKFVALTRRAGSEFADAGGPRDATLVRHVYDLHVLRPHYDPADAAIFAHMILIADAKVYGHQFPAYLDDPVGETLRAVAGLGEDRRFATAYAAFLRDMVYGAVPDFKAALATVTALGAHLKQPHDRRVSSRTLLK